MTTDTRESTIARFAAALNELPEDRQDLGLLGVECWSYAHSDRELPDHIKAALLGATYELACQRSGATSLGEEPEADDDEPRVTLIDDGQKSGIRVERNDWDETPPAWLEFRTGQILASVELGGKPGVELIIDGISVADAWSLAQLRQLRDDLDRLLRDERLIGALSEQEVPA